jgi:hypothetical protein
MTDQEVLDRVAEHLLRQNERSYAHGICAYRGAGGLKCAAGCIIPDHLYSPDMEGTGQLRDYGVRCAQVRDALGQVGANVNLVADLQGIHDRVSPEYWPTHLRAFAKSRDLDDSVIDRVLEELGR